MVPSSQQTQCTAFFSIQPLELQLFWSGGTCRREIDPELSVSPVRPRFHGGIDYAEVLMFVIWLLRNGRELGVYWELSC